MSKATCKTCGASGPPWHHVPSMFDPDGIGDPGHAMPKLDNQERNDLDDLFDDIRQTCEECEHPRCLSIVKSAKAVIADFCQQTRTALVEGVLREGPKDEADPCEPKCSHKHPRTDAFIDGVNSTNAQWRSILLKAKGGSCE